MAALQQVTKRDSSNRDSDNGNRDVACINIAR